MCAAPETLSLPFFLFRRNVEIKNLLKLNLFFRSLKISLSLKISQCDVDIDTI